MYQSQRQLNGTFGVIFTAKKARVFVMSCNVNDHVSFSVCGGTGRSPKHLHTLSSYRVHLGVMDSAMPLTARSSY